MFDPLTLALIGGAAGGLLNKKDPLKGALLGAGMGYGGGLLAAPASAGAAATAEGAAGLLTDPVRAAQTASMYGTDLGSQQTAMLAAQDAGLLTPIENQTMNLMKPIGQAASAANSAKGLLGGDQKPMPIQASPISPAPNTGPQGLAQLVGQNQQSAADRQRRDLEERMKRQEMIYKIGGYGGGGYGSNVYGR